MIKSEERLAHERKAFEFMYETRMKRALPNGICAEKEEGELKGIVDMAFMVDIITIDEMQAYYKEILAMYDPLKKLTIDIRKII